MKLSSFVGTASLLIGAASAFTTAPSQQHRHQSSCTSSARQPSHPLQMGNGDGGGSWFDFTKNWSAGGTGNSKAALDEQWEAQQEILRNRRAPQAERDQYFKKVEERRAAASEKQQNMWAWQTKTYKKGEDPLDEWKKRRADGSISDLDDQYGEQDKKGGIPLPMASFGVGGEFGVGGKFDNGGSEYIIVGISYCTGV